MCCKSESICQKLLNQVQDDALFPTFVIPDYRVNTVIYTYDIFFSFIFFSFPLKKIVKTLIVMYNR